MTGCAHFQDSAQGYRQGSEVHPQWTASVWPVGTVYPWSYVLLASLGSMSSDGHHISFLRIGIPEFRSPAIHQGLVTWLQ